MDDFSLAFSQKEMIQYFENFLMMKSIIMPFPLNYFFFMTNLMKIFKAANIKGFQNIGIHPFWYVSRRIPAKTLFVLRDFFFKVFFSLYANIRTSVFIHYTYFKLNIA